MNGGGFAFSTATTPCHVDPCILAAEIPLVPVLALHSLSLELEAQTKGRPWGLCPVGDPPPGVRLAPPPPSCQCPSVQRLLSKCCSPSNAFPAPRLHLFACDTGLQLPFTSVKNVRCHCKPTLDCGRRFRLGRQSLPAQRIPTA